MHYILKIYPKSKYIYFFVIKLNEKIVKFTLQYTYIINILTKDGITVKYITSDSKSKILDIFNLQ